MATANPIDYEAIRNTIARYCVALDTKDWQLFSQIFAEDVDADYPFSSEPIKGWQGLAKTIQDRLAHITSQHALTTQSIEVAEDGRSARAATYFTGIHFGQGKWKGQQVTAWGKYEDTLVVVPGTPELPGASGQWRISKRVVGFMGRLGEENVMKGESG